MFFLDFSFSFERKLHLIPCKIYTKLLRHASHEAVSRESHFTGHYSQRKDWAQCSSSVVG